MSKTPSLFAAAAGVLVTLCVPPPARAQSSRSVNASAASASLAAFSPAAPGNIHGFVQDEVGAPIAGAVVTAVGSHTVFAVTDRSGRFELRQLAPGSYLVRAHSSGFVEPRGQVVRVMPSVSVSSSISLHRATPASANTPPPAPPPIVAAGIGPVDEPKTARPEEPATAAAAAPADPSEIAWRLSHTRRSILKDVDQAIVASTSTDGFTSSRALSHAMESSARLASNFFTDTPFFGQFNLLTTSSFDAPQDLFAARAFLARSVANMLVGAPAGDADWTIRGAVTQGDISSWVLSGDYLSHATERHRYDIGMSYSTQRYDGGNVAALRMVTDGSRNVGTMHAFDTYALTPELLVTYGARYARYDYLDASSLFSPSVSVTVMPVDHLRLTTSVSQRSLAPGAEEFVQPDTGLWLPPQRTFSSLDGRAPLTAEQTTHVETGVERDLVPGATVTARMFYQRSTDQLVTLFGVDQPGEPSATLGHYFVANAAPVDVSGYSAGFKALLASRVRGAVEYSYARANWGSAPAAAFLLLASPSSVRIGSENIHDVSTSIEANVPETSTRVVVLYRVSNGFTRRDLTPGAAVDGRFDVQVRQSLPFLDFSTARWEMLVSVRNFFHDATSDQSIYDELLVVRPPKRVVGGLTLRF